MSNTQEILHAAILNNVQLCDLICSSHGATTQNTDLFWHAEHSVPFYPNFITVTDDTHDAVLKAVNNYPASRACSIKDSYDNLDLAPLGFIKIFDATWLLMASETKAGNHTYEHEWTYITTPDQLIKWEVAWSGKEIPSDASLFKASLLERQDIRFLASFVEGEIAAGVIINLSESVVGYSNIFVLYDDVVGYWSSVLKKIAQDYPAYTIVGYEHGEDLETAKLVGLQPLGQLSVWVRPAK